MSTMIKSEKGKVVKNIKTLDEASNPIFLDIRKLDAFKFTSREKRKIIYTITDEMIDFIQDIDNSHKTIEWLTGVEFIVMGGTGTIFIVQDGFNNNHIEKIREYNYDKELCKKEIKKIVDIKKKKK